MVHRRRQSRNKEQTWKKKEAIWHKKAGRQTLSAEIDPSPPSSMERSSVESASIFRDPSMEATTSFSSHAASAASAASTSRPRARPSRGIFVTVAGRRPPPVAAASMRRVWLPRPPWFSRVEPANQWTTSSFMWVHTGPASTHARDRNGGSIWVGCGPVHGFAEPVNRAKRGWQNATHVAPCWSMPSVSIRKCSNGIYRSYIHQIHGLIIWVVYQLKVWVFFSTSEGYIVVMIHNLCW